jgi:hypothetical protein
MRAIGKNAYSNKRVKQTFYSVKTKAAGGGREIALSGKFSFLLSGSTVYKGENIQGCLNAVLKGEIPP